LNVITSIETFSHQNNTELDAIDHRAAQPLLTLFEKDPDQFPKTLAFFVKNCFLGTSRALLNSEQ
jgi:hypothetical protein